MTGVDWTRAMRLADDAAESVICTVGRSPRERQWVLYPEQIAADPYLEASMKPTPAMIGAAHDVTMKEAGIILSHELIAKIYEAMQAQAACATRRKGSE